jgi:L-asparaginase II
MNKMNPILVEVYRAGVLESFHRGTICVVNEAGKIVFSVGDANQICYPRSAMKLLQVIPLLELGGMEHFHLSLEEIAVMCGSHNAEPEHLRVVESILNKIGATKDMLHCGPQYPSYKKAADEFIKTGTKPHHIHNNCSGKHAGMLALCKLLNYSTYNYLEPEHPIQQLIKKTCAAFYAYEESNMVTALDGCSAPIFSIPVYHQAVAYKNLVSMKNHSAARAKACQTVVEAVSTYPFLVAGSGRYCTDMMRITAPHIIGKTGAEGVFCMSFIKQKLGVCIKIDDGKMLPQYNVAQALIEATGMFSAEELAPLHHYAQEPLTNFNKLKTGEIKVRDGLFDAFRLPD